MADHAFAFSWKDVIARLRAESPDTVVEIPIAEIMPPLDAGMSRIESKGEDRRHQFGLVLDEKLACHVVVCGDWYHARLYVHASARLAPASAAEVLDRDDAPVRKRETGSMSPARLIADNPGLTLACAAGIAAGLAAALAPKRKQGAAAKGAGLGLAVGLAMVAVETANTSPKTSEVAQGLFAMLATAGIARRPAARVIRLASRSRSPSRAESKAKAKKKTPGHGLPI